LAYFSDEPCGMVEALRILRRMARVLGTPLRERIMIAASARPMSTTSFHAEHGGGSLSRIHDNFKELERYRWLVPDGIVTGGRRRGGVERLYRAVQLPLLDSNTWQVLPRPMRELYGWGACTTLLEEAEKAMRAGTMDARPNRPLAVVRCLADRLARDRILERADALFGSVFEEMKRADPRLAAGAERPIPAIAAIAVFDSPREPFAPGGDGRPAIEAAAPRVSPHSYLTLLAKAMIDPLRILILAELSLRPMSAKQFYEEFGGGDITKGKVYRAFRALREFGWLALDDTRVRTRGRGGRERFYRAARPAIVEGATWPALPAPLRETGSGAIVESLAASVREAIEAGTMDARTDRHFTWTPLLLDQLGWERVAEKLDALIEFVREEIAKAEARLAKSGETPIPMTVAVAGFESPAAWAQMH
jgi:DNA-binding transcriptional ArsR family regulator